MSLTDEEFRQKLEKHFSLYRINLRSPLVSQVSIDQWYRIDLLLVNELGLFRRADIEPDGQVIVTCELYSPNDKQGITPFSYPDPDYELDIRASRVFTEGQLKEEMTIPGFEHSGRGALEYRVRRKTQHAPRKPFYLQIKPTELVRFPKQQEKNLDFILPLVVGPIEVIPDLEPSVQDTSLPLELWNHSSIPDMVYEGYRVFSTSEQPPVNIAIHEMWDSGIPGKIWDSALVMLDVIKNMIEYHPEYIDQKHILDLSAGTGLLGLYVGSMMASPKIRKGKITITEIEEAVDLISKNVSINEYLTTQIDLQVKTLLWGNSEEAKACGKVDVIIASDVLYEAQFFEDLVKTFVDLCSPTTRIYIGYKRRGFSEEEEKHFWSLCEAHFNVTLLKYEGSQDLDDNLVPKMTLETGVQIYRLVPKN